MYFRRSHSRPRGPDSTGSIQALFALKPRASMLFTIILCTNVHATHPIKGLGLTCINYSPSCALCKSTQSQHRGRLPLPLSSDKILNIANREARKTIMLNSHLQYEERLINKRFSWGKRLRALKPITAAKCQTCNFQIKHANCNPGQQISKKRSARGDERPAPKKLGQPMRTIHAVDIPHDGVGSAGDGEEQNTACDMHKSSKPDALAVRCARKHVTAPCLSSRRVLRMAIMSPSGFKGSP